MNNDVFYIEAYYNGGMTGFEIIPRDAHFKIAKNGHIIAVIKNNNDGWQQISGDKLPDEVLQSIYQQIDRPKS
ncbi:MAG: hypothetical protein JWQ79_1144 [Mucilaginibacter sp.]|jgi:hypothetical protein|nr:hypothetical protein [Mucilaginibacter sp.]